MKTATVTRKFTGSPLICLEYEYKTYISARVLCGEFLIRALYDSARSGTEITEIARSLLGTLTSTEKRAPSILQRYSTQPPNKIPCCGPLSLPFGESSRPR